MNKVTPASNGPQVDPLHVSKGGRNAIVFILTMDLVKGYDQLTEYLEANPGYIILSVMAQAVQVQTNTHFLGGQAPQGFGITAILELRPRNSEAGEFDRRVFVARMEEALNYIRECLADYIPGDETGGIAAIQLRATTALTLLNEEFNQ